VRALARTTCKIGGGNPVCPFVCLSIYPSEHARPGMAARTGEGEGETPATVFDDNAGIVTTAGSLAESSTSSSSSSSATAAVAAAAVPTVILTESTATSAGSLPLTGSQQQSNLHQVHHQQQQSRQRVNLITDVVVNDVAGNLNDSRSWGLCCRLICLLPTPFPLVLSFS